MRDADVAGEVGSGTQVRKRREVALGARDGDPRAALAAEFEPLAECQCRLDLPGIAVRAGARKILGFEC